MFKKIAIGSVSILVLAVIAACNWPDGGPSVTTYLCDCVNQQGQPYLGSNPITCTVPCAQEGQNINGTCTDYMGQIGQPPADCGHSGGNCCGQPKASDWTCVDPYTFACPDVDGLTCLCEPGGQCH
jgi:hypothetical protein